MNREERGQLALQMGIDPDQYEEFRAARLLASTGARPTGTLSLAQMCAHLSADPSGSMSYLTEWRAQLAARPAPRKELGVARGVPRWMGR